MEILIIALIFILLVLPPLFTMRKQRQRQQEMLRLQSSLAPGQEVVTAGGVHGVVVATREDEVDLEVGRSTVVTFEKMAVVRSKSEAVQARPAGQRPVAERSENADDFAGDPEVR